VIIVEERYGFIYITTNIINNKKYIGKCEYKRKNGWKDYLGSGKLLKQAIKKYGIESFVREIIDEADNLEDLNFLERYYIEEYDAYNNKEFYNIACGGDGGNTRIGYTEEEYKKYCDKFKKPPEQNVMYGKCHTESSKIKNGKKTKERFQDESFCIKHSEAVKKAMQFVDRKKLAYENRTKKVLLKCVLCENEEYVYTPQQKFCSVCKNKYTKWQLEKLYKNSLENIC
jgi:group I intron endonuclease